MKEHRATAPRRPSLAPVISARAIVLVLMTCSAAVSAQSPAPAPAPPEPAPAPQRVEITGGRETDTEQRRRSTASKIVIGREEIDRYGDSTLGEVLRRLPGVTTPGAPGRGGPPRLRGLGSGYTQLLIDGQRIPPGFSLESLTPEQVERIEILRAPTAETGARAIAGTINIITREGFTRRLNDLRLGLGVEDGRVSPGINWAHNDTAGPLTYNLTGSVFRRNNQATSRSDTRVDAPDTGEVRTDRTELSTSNDQRSGISLGSRLQWRLGDGDMLMLNPTLFHAENEGERQSVLTERVNPLPLYATARSESANRFTTGRLNGQWRLRLGESRLELNGGLGGWRNVSRNEREEVGGAVSPRLQDEQRTARERSATLSGKLTRLAGGRADQPGSEHNLVAGAEIDAARRSESRTVIGSAAIDAGDGGDNLQAASLRTAVYAQDEWNISPQWSAYAGLRWEGITTRGTAEDGTRPTHRSSVWTPLLHAVWKPDPKSRDQIRMSLTRSYRSPGLTTLIAQRSINGRFPASGPNEPLSPDRIGNADLQPELATGIDLAAERYLAGGGVLSANLFHRRITDLMRSVTTLQTVPWSPVQRWVAQEVNIGNATTQGLELEAKFRLDQLVADAPRIDVRSNLSVFRSTVDGVPGPDNRLDQQAKGTANLGADYRFRALPLQLGGSLNWVPGYRTQLSSTQAVTVGTKRVFDAYGLWTFSPQAALRLSAGNLTARDYESGSLSLTQDASGAALRESARTSGPSNVNWQLRMELKL